MAVGAASGAAAGALSDVGINDEFMKNIAETMQPDSSVLFVLVRKATPDRVLEELKGSGGKILKTSLSHEDEAKVHAALDAAKKRKLTSMRPQGSGIFHLRAASFSRSSGGYQDPSVIMTVAATSRDRKGRSWSSSLPESY